MRCCSWGGSSDRRRQPRRERTHPLTVRTRPGPRSKQTIRLSFPAGWAGRERRSGVRWPGWSNAPPSDHGAARIDFSCDDLMCVFMTYGRGATDGNGQRMALDLRAHLESIGRCGRSHPTSTLCRSSGDRVAPPRPPNCFRPTTPRPPPRPTQGLASYLGPATPPPQLGGL